jgi:hypothetical protein
MDKSGGVGRKRPNNRVGLPDRDRLRRDDPRDRDQSGRFQNPDHSMVSKRAD